MAQVELGTEVRTKKKNHMRDYLRNIVGILALMGVVAQMQAQSLEFDGLDDHVTIPDLNGDFDFAHGFTVEAWVKPYSVNLSGDYRAIIRGAFDKFPSVSGGGWVMSSRRYGTFGLSVCTPSCEDATGGPMQPNVWNHLAGVYDGATIKVYFNGIPGGERPWQGDVTDVNFVLIGVWDASFRGLIDEVRVWNVARTEEQIAGAMLRPLNGDEPGLVGYWRFDEGSGQTVADSSQRANHGHLGREPSVDSYDPKWCASDVFNGAAPEPVIVIEAATRIPDQEFLILAVNNREAIVCLDGTQSSDADGDRLSFTWYESPLMNILGYDSATLIAAEVGEHSVTLVVSDGQHTATATATFEVITACQAIDRLKQRVVNARLAKNEKQQLLVTLEAACAAFERGGPTAGLNQMRSFQRKLKEGSNRLDPVLTQQLHDVSQAVIQAFSTALVPDEKPKSHAPASKAPRWKPPTF